MAFDPEVWLAENLDAHGDLAPPWARFPEISAGSLGWRMGPGEGWKWAWWDWVQKLPDDRETRLAYLRRHPPAPRPWASSAMAVVDPTYREDDESTESGNARWTALEATLEREGMVGDDVAFAAWLARNPKPEAPWTSGSSLAVEIRYGSRELTFLARWAAGCREDDLMSWLADVGTPPWDWENFAAALRRGTRPDTLPDDPRECVGILLAAHDASPPPPWLGGEDPSAIEQQFEDHTTYAGAWSEWVMDVFDDAPTFAAYLAKSPPAPPPWQRALHDNLCWLL